MAVAAQTVSNLHPPAYLFTTDTCMDCRRAKFLIDRRKLAVTKVDPFSVDGLQLRAFYEVMNVQTVPVLVVDGEQPYIGGEAVLKRLERMI